MTTAARVRRWLVGAAVLTLAVAIGFLIGIARVDPLVPRADAVVDGVDVTRVQVEAFVDGGGGIVVAPTEGPVTTLVILYPGGLVRPHAYTWLGVALAPRGVRTVIPAMPFDLAVLGRDRARGLTERYGASVERIVLAGHSLGGAMVAAYAVRNPNDVDGLVLMGAYPAGGDDLSSLDLHTLVLAAEHDGLASLTEVQDGLARLPSDASLQVLPGAVHAFFGRYGPQRGDGIPTTPRSVVERDLVTRMEAFLADLDE